MSLSLTLPQFPQFTIKLHKFTNVTNATTLKTSLLNGDTTHQFAFINSPTVLCLEQLLSAVYRALLDYTGDKIRTRSLHSECILALSPTQNIVDALKRYGIQDDSRELVVVKVIEQGKDSEEYDLSVVEGDEVPVSDEEFQRSVDIELVKKNYKLKSDDHKTLTRQIIGGIQLRGH